MIDLFFKKGTKDVPQDRHKTFFHKIASVFFTKNQLSEEDCAQIEKILIEADFGYSVSKELILRIKKNAKGSAGGVSEDVKKVVFGYIREILFSVASPLTVGVDNAPHVLMVCGVNGNGKTTTIGKIAYKYKQAGLKVLIAACDTFRAMATEQLDVWAKRAGCDIFCGKEKAEPASVAYGAISKAAEEGYDLLLIDTAGRLHTQQNLMDELGKVVRVVGKVRPGAPHDIVLVLDANTGQNALSQIERFQQAANITGLILTKFDGTAKGGVVVNIANKHNNLKIHAVGMGEGIEDLHDFDIDKFCEKIGIC